MHSMDNKDFVNLLLRDIKEMSLLCESLSNMDSIPVSLLELSKGKVESMASIIDQLLKSQGVAGAQEAPIQETMDTDPSSSLLEDGTPTDEPFEEGVKEVVEGFAEAQEALTEFFGKVGSELEKSVKELIDSIETPTTEENPSENDSETASDVQTETETETGSEVEVEVEANDLTKTNSEEKATEMASEKEQSKKRAIPTTTTSPDRRFVKTLKLCIGDRFRYKKELFNDDMELLNRTMAELDQLNSLQEAFEYIERFDWSEDNPAVEDFVQLLQSRFS